MINKIKFNKLFILLTVTLFISKTMANNVPSIAERSRIVTIVDEELNPVNHYVMQQIFVVIRPTTQKPLKSEPAIKQIPQSKTIIVNQIKRKSIPIPRTRNEILKECKEKAKFKVYNRKDDQQAGVK